MSSILGERADDSDTGNLMTTLLILDYLHKSCMARSLISYRTVYISLTRYLDSLKVGRSCWNR